MVSFIQFSLSQGGISSGYKNYIADKGLNDETYNADCVALIEISGTAVHHNKAVQVDAVCSINGFANRLNILVGIIRELC